MSVTPEVSHVEIWPYVVSAAAASANQAVTAVRMLVSSMTLLRRRTGLGSARAAAKRAITIHVPFILFGAAPTAVKELNNSYGPRDLDCAGIIKKTRQFPVQNEQNDLFGAPRR